MKFPIVSVASLLLLLGSVSSSAEHEVDGRDLRGSGSGRGGGGKKKGGPPGRFNRISTFFICQTVDDNCDDDTETTSEIVTATEDGMTLVYTDSKREEFGTVDISDPKNPTKGYVVDLSYLGNTAEPTSVAVRGNKYAFVAVNTSPDFVNPSGKLEVYDLTNESLVRSFDLGGQPDSVAISPDGKFAAVAIENERDEDLDDGKLPQLPPGFLYVLDISASDPNNWLNGSVVDLTGLDSALYNTDPEPEYVDINENNVCVVTLQENNAVVLVDLETLTVTKDFTAGTVDLDDVDVVEDDRINQTQKLSDLEGAPLPREPDGVAWIGTDFVATADEGDLDGGTRGFTVFAAATGDVVYASGNDFEHEAARLGHYPESRSENKGTEPENLVVGRGFVDGKGGSDDFVFVNAERAGLTFVYHLDDSKLGGGGSGGSDKSRSMMGGGKHHRGLMGGSKKSGNKVRSKQGLTYVQALPTLYRPEGAKAIPSRNLVVVAGEEDDRGDKYRAGISIYEYQLGAEPAYPTLVSGNRKTAKSKKKKKKKGTSGGGAEDGGGSAPIPWGALSGLSSCPSDKDRLWAVEDNFYKSSRFFEISTKKHPAKIKKDVRIRDDHGVLAAVPLYGDFDADDRAALINDDGTVNLDPEGISACADGKGFWIASEGSGTVGDDVESLNFLVKIDKNGIIEEVVTLPDGVNGMQARFGFEGVANPEDDDRFVVVAIQRAWGPEANPRLGIYDTHSKSWKFVFYPLDAPESQNGGWVGLSDITPLGHGKFLVLERDNQANFDAAIKKIYQIDLGHLYHAGMADPTETVTKHLVRDVLPDIKALNGMPYEKVEGMAITKYGDVWIINDNDGVDDNSGETQLLNLGHIW